MKNKKSYSLQVTLIILILIENICDGNICRNPSIAHLYFSILKKFFDRLPLFKRHPSLMLSVAIILPISQSKTGSDPSNLVKDPFQSKQLVVWLMTANLLTGWVKDKSQSFIRRLTK